MKTTPEQFVQIEGASLRRGSPPVIYVPIDTIVLKNIVADLRALQQYEAAGAAQFKAPMVKAYVADALTQARDLLDMVKQSGDHLKGKEK